MNLWIDKYRPTEFTNYLAGGNIKSTIKNWLTDFKAQKPNCKNCLFLVGPPGVGKTTIAHLILKMFDYDIIEFNTSDARTPKLVKAKMETTLGKKNVLNLLCNKKQNMAIIMDEIDGMTTGERSGLTELIKIMFPKKNVIAKDKRKFNYLSQTPFICISNTLDKKLNEIKAKSVFIRFTMPTRTNLAKYCRHILENEQYEYNDEIVNIIIDNSQHDYRRLGIQLEYVYKSKVPLTAVNVINLLENYAKKDIEHTYYECVDKMLNKYQGIDDTIALYNSNKSLIPMIFYENFGEYIINNKTNTDKDKLESIVKIYRNYSESDILDYNIYINQDWGLYNVNSVYKCIEPSYIINNTLKRKAYNNSSTLNFSALLNKTSQEYCNIKYINNIKIKIFKLSGTNIVWQFTDLFFNYIHANKYSTLRNLIKHYKMGVDDMDKLMKYLPAAKQQIYTLKRRNELKRILFY